MSTYDPEVLVGENRKKILGSSIFGESPEPLSPQSRQRPPQAKYEYSSKQPAVAPPQQPYQQTFRRLSPRNYDNEYEQPQAFSHLSPINPPPALQPLTPFPDFHLNIFPQINPIDLGVRPKTNPTDIKLTKAQMTAGPQFQKIRDELAHDQMVYIDQLKKLQQEEPLKIQNYQLNQFIAPQPVAQESTYNIPQFTTKSEFVFPDGSTKEYPSAS